MEIKNKLDSDQRGGGKGNNGGKKGKSCQGTCIQYPWTKPQGGRTEGGRWGWVRQGRVVWGGKWRQLYFNKNKKKEREREREGRKEGKKKRREERR